MTDKNKELRALVTKIENTCTACLRGQPHGDEDCERMLVKTLAKIADMTSEFAGMVEIEVYDLDWETDGERVKLPKSVKMIVYANPDIDNEAVANQLSDEYGWLVKGFLWRRT